LLSEILFFNKIFLERKEAVLSISDRLLIIGLSIAFDIFGRFAIIKNVSCQFKMDYLNDLKRRK